MQDFFQDPSILIRQNIIDKNYVVAIDVCEDLIATNPEIKQSYWYLGLIFLIQGQEAEAQMTWAMGFADIDPQLEKENINDLIAILEIEANRIKATATAAEKDSLQIAWLIRRHLYEITPEYLSNLLHIIQLTIDLESLDESDELFNHLVEILQSKVVLEPNNENLTLLLLSQILDIDPHHPIVTDLAQACIDRFPQHNINIFNILLNQTRVLINAYNFELALKYALLCYQLQPKNRVLVANIANLYQDLRQNLESIPFAKKLGELSLDLTDQIASNYLITRGFIKTGGRWKEAQTAYQNYFQAVQSLIDSNYELDIMHAVALCGTGIFSPYLQDNPKVTRRFMQQLGDFCQPIIREHFVKEFDYIPHSAIKTTNRILKIGYISGCFYEHSVGWISRWLLKHHNHQHFQVYIYSLKPSGDSLQQFFRENCYQFWQSPSADPTNLIKVIIDQIAQDEIDILVDLDSSTSSTLCAVMALKPSPLQITWLGSDASGIPAIDYFIADPFVLPEDAQDYYSTKIWQLPHTYVAVDGFEIGTPSLCRSDLNIPNDAIIYLSSQTSIKRHPETIKLQMQILQSVPNSYFLIKGGDNKTNLQELFEQFAQDSGVSIDRLRFLPDVKEEAVHRANLAIADVVLDTYPYNGATTTLETLWMGVPLVTLVGKQFAARNSYTMMVSVGVTEGVAWNDSEYVEWGVRLGIDASLRQDISVRLRASRQTSPLWNGKQFAQNMENAYQQMWEIFCKV